MEWHINEKADERRLRAQRSHFGITEAAPKPADAIEIAKSLARLPQRERPVEYAQDLATTAFPPYVIE